MKQITEQLDWCVEKCHRCGRRPSPFDHVHKQFTCHSCSILLSSGYGGKVRTVPILSGTVPTH